ncbi:hypothetical protein ANI_1_714124 [Paecilomyces variotii No. 5]|uniref:Alb1-domain-containing protein n=1 Tax=Byssochlamys spectabilis (strain No. 5 / NBRC 109023) TaxID=1356009 RepID=V5GD24_BYSSN|nr:hypothetical protein ANI_1_714124 [Paecilomyces variotii No. 5]
MAKTPKVKGNSKPSTHSRAARRAASPSVDLDKSLISLPRPETPQIPSTHVNSGITKKKSKSKPKTRAQRLRQEKGLERAEIVMDQLEKKVNKSLERGRSINRRKVDWEDLNRKSNRFTAALEVENDGQEEQDNAMEDDNDVRIEKFTRQTVFSAATAGPVAEQPAGLDEDEEIT